MSFPKHTFKQSTEVSSYFELPRKERQSNSSYEEVSPLHGSGSIAAASQRKSRRPLPFQDTRSYSDSVIARKRFNAIAEDLATHHSSPARTPELATASEITKIEDSRLRSQNQNSSQSSEHVQITQVAPGPQQASNKSSAESNPKRPKHVRQISYSPNKARIARHRTDTTSSIPDNMSVREKKQSLNSIRMVSLPIQPLRPPSVSTKHSENLPEHNVKIEQPFTKSGAENVSTTTTEQVVRRRSSINPKNIFSVSVGAFSKMGGKPSKQAANVGEGHLARPKFLNINAPDHQTSLRKQQIGAGLMRVTSMLQEIKKSDPKTRTTSNRTAIYGQSMSPGLSPRHEIPMPLQLGDRVKSMELTLEETDSHNSSLVRVRIGPVPNNTPDEKATYTVINQEGELEEFLKVDISIRGQTSYLPSEARRIHTPPLPSDGHDGRRRGFFFDYGLAKEDRIADFVPQKGQTHLNPPAWQTEPHTAGHSSHANSTSKRMLMNSSHHGVRSKTGDWYDAQLAKFESLSLEDNPFVSAEASEFKGQAASDFEKEQQRLENEAQLDHSIPEHLPTSPLCPRHPRYWRVVKKKGSQFRGC